MRKLLLGGITASLVTLFLNAAALAQTVTPNINLQVPTVGADSNDWGDKINADLAAIDALFATTKTGVLGSAALASTGTSGATVPLLNGANTWSSAQTFSGGLSGALTGNASTATSATTAGSASTASFATNAGHATNADNATNATNATNAGHASTAESATTAGSASNAVSLAVGDGAAVSFDGGLQRWNFYQTGGVVIAYIDASGVHLP